MLSMSHPQQPLETRTLIMITPITTQPQLFSVYGRCSGTKGRSGCHANPFCSGKWKPLNYTLIKFWLFNMPERCIFHGQFGMKRIWDHFCHYCHPWSSTCTCRSQLYIKHIMSFTREVSWVITLIQKLVCRDRQVPGIVIPTNDAYIWVLLKSWSACSLTRCLWL